MVSDEAVVAKLRELLKEVDLEKTTERQLRQTLEKDFEEDLSDRKALIRAEIERYLNGDENENGEENDDFEATLTAELEDANEPEENVVKKRRAGGPLCTLSPALADVLGEEELRRTEVVKKLWDYIRANNLQDPSNKRNILLDSKLSNVFTSPLTMFTMNKQLSKHLHSTGSGRSASGETAASKPNSSKTGSSKPAAKRKKTEDDNEAKKPRRSGFTKPLRISSELADWMGKEEIPRSELTKFFWSYVKENQLQDPKDGRMILCDDKLKALTGQDSLSGFGFMKYFSQHFIKD